MNEGAVSHDGERWPLSPQVEGNIHRSAHAHAKARCLSKSHTHHKNRFQSAEDFERVAGEAPFWKKWPPRTPPPKTSILCKRFQRLRIPSRGRLRNPPGIVDSHREGSRILLPILFALFARKFFLELLKIRGGVHVRVIIIRSCFN